MVAYFAPCLPCSVPALHRIPLRFRLHSPRAMNTSSLPAQWEGLPTPPQLPQTTTRTPLPTQPTPFRPPPTHTIPSEAFFSLDPPPPALPHPIPMATGRSSSCSSRSSLAPSSCTRRRGSTLRAANPTRRWRILPEGMTMTRSRSRRLELIARARFVPGGGRMRRRVERGRVGCRRLTGAPACCHVDPSRLMHWPLAHTRLHACVSRGDMMVLSWVGGVWGLVSF